MLRINPGTLAGGCDEPYRVRYYDDVMDLALWNKLVDQFPPDELLTPVAAGYKNSMGTGKKSNAGFQQYITDHPLWGQFYSWVHDHFPKIARDVMDLPNTTGKNKVRFEFSGLPGEGGDIDPHPDTAKKVATAVMFFTRDWKPQYGGAFEVLRHRTDPERDWTNWRCPWEEVDTILEVAPKPARILFMRRTHNSLHGVRPCKAPFTRRTVTINFIDNLAEDDAKKP
jgi:hypothetical protein